jgi:hypothetical protein
MRQKERNNMTVDEFTTVSKTLDAAALKSTFEVRVVTIDGTERSVNVERTLIQDDDDPKEVDKWILENTKEAIESRSDGVEHSERTAGGLLNGRWTWVTLIAHNEGGVTILNAQ